MKSSLAPLRPHRGLRGRFRWPGGAPESAANLKTTAQALVSPLELLAAAGKALRAALAEPPEPFIAEKREPT
ncbi:hypothetical protein AOLI_G00056070 [Acnodon oligacanthus]